VSLIALTPMDHRSRLSTLADQLGPASLDGLMVTNPIHIRYLTGFAGSAGFVIVGHQGSLLVTDDRYGEVAVDASSAIGANIDVCIGAGVVQREAAAAFSTDWATIGLESDNITWDSASTYSDEWFSHLDVVASKGIIGGLRLVKEDAEVMRIEQAAAITDAALAHVRPMLGNRPTERSFQLALDRAIIDGGADDLSFATIVASGANGSRPHHVPGQKVIERGDLVVVDVGALVDGYHSDMTRSFVVGQPSAEATEMLEVTHAAQAAGVASVRPGAKGDDIDAASRAVIEKAGLGAEFVHGVGHGVGLLIHEDPFLKGSALPLVVGQVVTVEPGVYRSGFGGVRVEDTVVVTPDGCRPLTHSPKDPVVA
jgi:Xaa-Pro aminopeptidase